MNNIIDLVTENEMLIYSIINKYTYYYDKDDLYQVAVIGLINAHKNFDSSMNTKFSSYAYFYMLGEVKKYIRESNTFKVSKQLEKLSISINKARELLTQKLGKYPTNLEVAHFLEIEESDILEVDKSRFLVESLDSENEDVCNLYNKYGYSEQNYEASFMDLNNELESLEEPYKSIIKNRYFNEFTQSETAKILNMSQVQVSRKEKEGLQRLRTRL